MYTNHLLGTSQAVHMVMSLKEVLGICRHIDGSVAPAK